jgi:DNA modification methylase
MAFEIKHGDCLEVMRGMADNSVDAIVTDPPYGLSFMGKKWDYDVPEQAIWEECLRVLKPGGHLLAFAGTRTQHRMAVRIEDAGFEIRDMIAWVYGSGFPKSLDVSKALDKAAGAEREVVGIRESYRPKANATRDPEGFQDRSDGAVTLPATEAARQWQGWGTALKPALEPITVARKPMVGTVAENVLQHGTGAINVDGCRVPLEEDCRLLKGGTYGGNRGSDKGTSIFGTNTKGLEYEVPSASGRWPANLIHDGSDEVMGLFPLTGASKAAPRGGTNPNPMDWGNSRQDGDIVKGHDDNGGSAARFFYCAKASKSDRGESNGHPTVKPTELMRYLVRLVTQPGGTVLDPFTGSGSTGKAAVLEGFEFIGIEREAEYVAIAEARIVEAQRSLGLFA